MRQCLRTPSSSRSALALASVAVAALVGPAVAAGQERPVSPDLVSDRPGLGDGVHVVAPGVLHTELGVELADRGPATEVSLGQAVLRYGAGPLEVRAHLNSLVVRRNGSDDAGFQDLALGTKFGIVGDADASFRASGLATLGLPTGSAAFGGDQAAAGLTALAEWSPAGSGIAVTGNAGITQPLEDGDPAWTFIVTPGGAVDSVEGLGVYGGWAGFFADGGDENWIEAGLTYLLDPETQLDVNGGWSPDAEDLFVGVGLARRIR